MKVTLAYNLNIDTDLPVEELKKLHTAWLCDEPIPDSVLKAIGATPEWQSMAKIGEFELTGIYNPNYEEEGNEAPLCLWEEE